MGSNLRIVIAKPGLDGHDRGAKVVARTLRDAGHEVIYTGLRRTAKQIVETVRDEDARFLGLSSLSGAHNHLFPRVCELLIEEGLSDVIVFGGGIIPEDDRPALFSSGIKAIFGPGTPTNEILEFIDTASSMDDVGVGAKTDWHWQSTAGGEILNLELINDAINGDRRSLARTLSGIENGTLNIMEIQQNADIPNRIDSGNWKSLAITGAPGVGKSCLIDKLLSIWAGSGMKIALLAIDPSSPRTGGALLGDRVRITSVDDDSLKENIYIRSIATRKSSGNVPLIVADMVEFLHMAGWERVVIETVGSGQSEVRCAAIADRIVVVEGPARGDGVQAEKAGLLELADAVIVNKSDLKGAEKHAEELLESFELGLGDVPPVMLTSALNETGISEAADALLDLPDTGRSVRARWRERLLAHYERKILESPDLEEILSLLAVGSISVDEAINTLVGR